MVDAANQNRIARDRGRGPEHFIVELVGRQDLKLRPGLQDERQTALVETEDFVAIGPGRGSEARGAGEPLAVVLFTGVGVEAAENARLLFEEIQAVCG